MLELRPNGERCDKDLAPDEKGAVICTFECTFCVDCGENVFHAVCPNCSGELLSRPSRPAALLEQFPCSRERVLKPH